MKKFILTILFLLFINVRALAFDSSIKFVQITDSHFQLSSPDTVDVLKKAVEDINSLKDVSFVVFTGDNINRPNPKDLQEFLKIVKKLRVPYYLVMGNHDAFKSGELSKAHYNEILKNNNFFWFHKSWNYTFKKNGYIFIVLDGAKEVIPGPAGYYRADTLNWLDKQLAKYKDKPVIIFQHFPVIDMPDFEHGRLKTHRTYQAEKYLYVLSKHDNVLAILSGHFHVNSETMKDGVYHISSPTLLKHPYSYKIVDIVSKKGLSPIIYTQLKAFE